MATKGKNAKSMAAEPTMVESQSAAAALVLQHLRSLHAQIPGFQQPASNAEQQRLISNAGVSQDYLESACVMLESSPALAAATAIDPARVREAVRFAAAYEPVADELEALARAVRYTILVRRDAAGKDARVLFNVAAALARKPENVRLKPFLSEMKKANKRPARKPKAAPAAEFKAGKDL
jgi:hypothetical protein